MEFVTAEGFPFGVRCAECGEQIPLSAPVFWTPEGMAGDMPVEAPVCTACNDVKAFTSLGGNDV